MAVVNDRSEKGLVEIDLVLDASDARCRIDISDVANTMFNLVVSLGVSAAKAAADM